MAKTVRIIYKPFEKQQAFHQSPARFKVLACGMRGGKTTAGGMEALKHSIGQHCSATGLGWIVEPTFPLTEDVWRRLLTSMFVPELVRRVNKSKHRFELVNGFTVEMKSADRPERLVQVGLDWLWVDEPQLIPEDVWQDSLRARLFDKEAPAWFTGTPRGTRSWFHALWLRGQDRNQRVYESWNWPTWDNPEIPKGEIEESRASMPERLFRQNIAAEWLSEAAGVFRYVDERSVCTPLAPVSGRAYILGLDLARVQDYTVAAVFQLPDKSSSQLVQVHLERMQRVDWAIQERRIVELARRYNNALIYADATGVGDPECERLLRAGCRLEPVKFTTVTKAQVVDNLALMLEQDSIRLLADEVQKAELKDYEYTLMPGGSTRYGAVGEKHDDCVIACALAAWGSVSRPRVEAHRFAPVARW